MARKKVTSVPALADWGAVDNALRDIRECQHTPDRQHQGRLRTGGFAAAEPGQGAGKRGQGIR